MKPHFRDAIAEINEDIVKLDADLKRLLIMRDGIEELYGGDDAETTARAPRTPKVHRGPRAPRAAGTAPVMAAAGDEEKPDTLAGAMKLIIPTLSEPFTAAALTEQLRADTDFTKLLEACGPSAMHGNLAYWAKTGKLEKAGDGADAQYVNKAF